MGLCRCACGAGNAAPTDSGSAGHLSSGCPSLCPCLSVCLTWLAVSVSARRRGAPEGKGGAATGPGAPTARQAAVRVALPPAPVTGVTVGKGVVVASSGATGPPLDPGTLPLRRRRRAADAAVVATAAAGAYDGGEGSCTAFRARGTCAWRTSGTLSLSPSMRVAPGRLVAPAAGGGIFLFSRCVHAYPPPTFVALIQHDSGLSSLASPSDVVLILPLPH